MKFQIVINTTGNCRLRCGKASGFGSLDLGSGASFHSFPKLVRPTKNVLADSMQAVTAQIVACARTRISAPQWSPLTFREMLNSPAIKAKPTNGWSKSKGLGFRTLPYYSPIDREDE